MVESNCSNYHRLIFGMHYNFLGATLLHDSSIDNLVTLAQMPVAWRFIDLFHFHEWICHIRLSFYLRELLFALYIHPVSSTSDLQYF